MLNDNLKMDMTRELNIRENLKKSLIVTTGSCIIGAIVFVIAYFFTENAWLLSVGLILFVSGIAYIFVVKAIEKKYVKKDE